MVLLTVASRVKLRNCRYFYSLAKASACLCGRAQRNAWRLTSGALGPARGSHWQFWPASGILHRSRPRQTCKPSGKKQNYSIPSDDPHTCFPNVARHWFKHVPTQYHWKQLSLSLSLWQLRLSLTPFPPRNANQTGDASKEQNYPRISSRGQQPIQVSQRTRLDM